MKFQQVHVHSYESHCAVLSHCNAFNCSVSYKLAFYGLKGQNNASHVLVLLFIILE